MSRFTNGETPHAKKDPVRGLLKWWARRESNPHALLRQILNLVRLPISPRAHVFYSIVKSLFRAKLVYHFRKASCPTRLGHAPIFSIQLSIFVSGEIGTIFCCIRKLIQGSRARLNIQLSNLCFGRNWRLPYRKRRALAQLDHLPI